MKNKKDIEFSSNYARVAAVLIDPNYKTPEERLQAMPDKWEKEKLKQMCNLHYRQRLHIACGLIESEMEKLSMEELKRFRYEGTD